MSAVELKDLRYVYSRKTPFEKTALDGVSLKIEEGEFVALVGRTGSGKSTLVQHLNGLIKPQEGEIHVLGMDARNKKTLKQLRFAIGMVFQYPEYQLFEETVAKDVAFGPKNMKLGAEEIDRRVRRAMELVGLPYEKFADRSPFELSGGEKRRAAIAGVVAMEPKILVLDEPFAGLDPSGVREITSLIFKLKKEVSPTVVLVSHNMDAVAALADRMIALADGKIVIDAPPEEAFADRELIKGIDLDLPFAARICDALRERGIFLSKNIVTAGRLKRELVELMTQKTHLKSNPDADENLGEEDV